MKFKTLFPLVVAVSELKESARYKQAFVNRISELRQSADNYVEADSSWTGDVHGIDTLHYDPVFNWLSEQVVVNAIHYLDKLAYDLNKYDLYLQRSWPVISSKGQEVTPHSHPTAHLSAVYYVSIPPKLKGGNLVFINEAKPNELFEGASSNMTKGYKEINKFNSPMAHFRPVEGHLVIFPANAQHAVEPHETDEMRISISYDLILTTRSDNKTSRTPEFILPSPTKWRKAGFKINNADKIQPSTTQQPSTQQPGENGHGSLDGVPEMKPLPSPM